MNPRRGRGPQLPSIKPHVRCAMTQWLLRCPMSPDRRLRTLSRNPVQCGGTGPHPPERRETPKVHGLGGEDARAFLTRPRGRRDMCSEVLCFPSVQCEVWQRALQGRTGTGEPLALFNPKVLTLKCSNMQIGITVGNTVLPSKVETWGESSREESPTVGAQGSVQCTSSEGPWDWRGAC